MDAIEKYLIENGYKFYDDEAFDYYYKDAILVYRTNKDTWGAQITRGYAIEDICADDIKTVESLKEVIEFLKAKVDWKKIEELDAFIQKQTKQINNEKN